jgi:hypothetical protein
MLRFGIEGTRPAPGDADLPRALAAWLDLVTTPTTVLFVDDAPRLDAGGLMLLATLARALTVIVTARADELPAEHPLRSTFYDLAAAGLADRLLLAPLTDDATAALIRCLAGVDLPTLSSQVTARAAGNPLFLIALLQALFEAGTLYIDAGDRWAYTGAALPLPPSVRELIEQRMQRLDQAQRSLLDAVAVIGQDFDFALLQRVVGMPEASLFATLDDLLSLGLVVEPRSGSRGEFAPAHAGDTAGRAGTPPPWARRRCAAGPHPRCAERPRGRPSVPGGALAGGRRARRRRGRLGARSLCR